jgi:predicted DCC family thiol-disulfide oxidoreductase YuxK
MLVYDGDCSFCTRSAELAERLLPVGIPVVPWQSIADLDALGLTVHDVTTKVWWVGTDGRLSGGHEAIARCGLAMRKWYSPLAALLLLPPISFLAALLYSWVATNRHLMPGGTDACRVVLPEPLPEESATSTGTSSLTA